MPNRKIDRFDMESKTKEVVVGFFLLFGLVLIGGLVLVFGRVRDQLSDSYSLKVTFPNAEGLLKGSNVDFAGAPIGTVVSAPRFINEGRAVEVDLRIRREALIRNDARFMIGSTGLLGDRFVDVEPKSYTAPFLKPGDVVNGERVASLSDIAARTEPLVENATAIAVEVRKTMITFNEKILTPETTAELRSTISRANSVMAKAEAAVSSADKSLQDLSSKIDPLVTKVDAIAAEAKETLIEAKKTMTRINEEVLTKETAADLRATVARAKDFLEKAEGAVVSADRAVKQIGEVVSQAKTGKGPIGRLLNDPKLADDIAVFIRQLREHGILWYSNAKVVVKEEGSDSSAANPSPARSKGQKIRR